MNPRRKPAGTETEESALDAEVLTGDVVDDDIGQAWSQRARAAGAERLARANQSVREATGRLRKAGAEEPEQSGPRVFVSYSRRDKKLANDVCEDLRRFGAGVWVDSESIVGGAEFNESISIGIRDADVLVVLLSPNVLRNPERVFDEIALAKEHSTRIIPVRLKRIGVLPAGFDLVLSGLHWVDLFPPQYDDGMTRLVTAIGELAPAEAATLRERAQRFKGKVVRVSHERELASKARTAAGAAAAGAAVAGAFMFKVLVDQEARRLQEQQESSQRELADYRRRTTEMLEEAMVEVTLTDDMRPDLYRDEFRPAFSKILGRLEETRPNDPAVAARHNQLVTELQRAFDGYDKAMNKARQGDDAAYRDAVVRSNVAWAKAIRSMIKWLSEG